MNRGSICTFQEAATVPFEASLDEARNMQWLLAYLLLLEKISS